ncbi:MAG: hypothetical protein LBS35_11570, partial [Synergistaceae bacterium]|jgi:hypothetical protein|nr:hypothetical protein [Synergistaceae bacterium]
VDRGDKWVAGGTSNVGTKGKTEEKDTMIRNKDQVIFSFKLPELADSESSNYGKTRRNEWTSVDAADGDSSINSGDRGWYIPLRKPYARFEDEYVTTVPIMINGKLYAATFQEEKIESGNAACDSGQKNGVTRLYVVGLDTGRAATWSEGHDKYLEFKGLKITGFTHSKEGKKETLLVHYERLSPAEASASIGAATSAEDSLSESDLPNTLEITELGGSDTEGPLIAPNDQIVNYWRYIE